MKNRTQKLKITSLLFALVMVGLFCRVIEQVRVMNQRGETVLACDHVYLVKKRAG